MDLIMAAACQRPQPAQYEQQQQWEQQWEGQSQQQRWQQGDGDAQQWEAAGDGEPEQQRRHKPVVVLVGATLDEPLVEHVVEQVGGSGCRVPLHLPLMPRSLGVGV